MRPDHVTVHVTLTAKPGCEEQVHQEVVSLLAPTRAEPGCIVYDVHRATDNRARFMFYEIWTSEAHLKKHLEMPYLKRWVAMAPDLLTGPMELTLWRKHA